MSIQPEHLLTFARVAEAGSLSTAAQSLHRTQPALSSQLRLLGESVGEPLYLRHRHGIRLTPAGEGLLPYAQALVRALEGARAYARELRSVEAGSLRIAASTTVAAYLLPLSLARFRHKHPGVMLQLQSGNTREVIEHLGRGEVELAFIEGPGEAPVGTHSRSFARDRLVLVGRPDHPLAQRGQLRLTDLAGQPLIWREAGSGTREVAEQALLRAGVRVEGVLELSGTEAVKEAVLEGLGVAFLSALAVHRSIEAGQLVVLPLKLAGLERNLTLLHPPLEVLSWAARRFLEEELQSSLEQFSTRAG